MAQEVVRPRLADLAEIARRAMLKHGLAPDFPPDVHAEVERLRPPDLSRPDLLGAGVRDLRTLPWSSIDNDDTRDLDQLTVAQPGAQPGAQADAHSGAELDARSSARPAEGSAERILVAIADVAALVSPDSAIDRHARANTTSVYTPARVFPMLPERLSTDLTSLNPDEDRLAVVVDITVQPSGSVGAIDVYRALVHNHAKLTYGEVAAWLDGAAPPPALARVSGLDAQLRTQDAVATLLRVRRYELGALDIETVRARPIVKDGVVVGLEGEGVSRSRQLIEDVMIAANEATARFLRDRRVPGLRRVVRAPDRWDRLVEIAAKAGDALPAAPDAPALARFMERRRAADPGGYADLSLAVVKLLGSGDYAVERPDEPSSGHFGLSVQNYTHATAPNRRYPDLATQRMVVAALEGRPMPYSVAELEVLAAHCTRQEDQANKVERAVQKAAASAYLGGRIGETFDAIVTGANARGTWVRTLATPVEGKLVAGSAGGGSPRADASRDDKIQVGGVQVGDRVRVRLLRIDPGRGHVDFALAE